jgi:general secretion pathway protein L
MLTSFVAIIFRFFRWWFDELSGLLPPGWRAALSNRKLRLVVTLSDTEAQLLYGRGGILHELGSLPLQGENTMGGHQFSPDNLAPYLSRADEVVLRLPRSSMLRRQVELPLAASENLREVIAIEMDRHTPFNAEEVYFDYRLLSKDTAKKRLTVDLVVATRTLTDRVLDRLRGWGIDPDRIDVEGGKADDGARFNLLSSLDRARGWRGQKPTVAAAVAVCVLLTIAIYLPVQQKQNRLAQFESQLAIAKAEAADAKELSEKIETLLDRSDFVVREKLQRPPFAELLTEITLVIPDDTWIIQLRWRGDRLTLAGYSASPSSLIALLEQSELLSEVQFNSPVTVDQRIGLERFNLSAKVLMKEES